MGIALIAPRSVSGIRIAGVKLLSVDSLKRSLLLVRFSNRPSGATTPVSMSLTGSLFSSDSAPRPLYGAF